MKRFFITVIFFLSSLSLYALENFSLNVESSFDYTTGEAGEHLFTRKKNVENEYTSLLVWEEKPFLSAGIKADGNWNNYFFKLNTTAGIPGDSGSMYDYDWFMNTNVCQSRSISVEHITGAFYSDLEAGYTFRFDSRFAVIPFFGVTNNFIDFKGDENAPGLMDPYPYDSDIISYDSAEAKSFRGVSITYWRYTLLTWAGFYYRFNPLDAVTFDFFTAISPFTYVFSEDYHSNSKSYYHDNPIGGFTGIKLGLNTNIRISKIFSIQLDVQYFYLGLIRGETYTSYTPAKLGTHYKGSEVGATQEEFTVSAGVKINLF